MLSAPKLSQSLIKGFSIIELLSFSNEMSVTELSRRLGLNKSSVHRFLRTLVALGYAESDPVSKHYRLTLKLFEVGSSARGLISLEKLAMPFMERLAEETQETISLGILDKGEVVHVSKIESKQLLRSDLVVGTRLPPNCTSLGKSILAHLPSDKLKETLSMPSIIKMTSKSITDPNDLKKELSSVRRLGYAINDEEFSQGIRCVGVPIKGADRRVLAALSIAGPSIRIHQREIKRFSKLLMDAALEISKALSHVK